MSDSSHKAPIAELTPRVIVLGLTLAVIMGAANVYLGLKAGMTVSASIPAAVIATLIFRKLLGGGTILEANQVQTAASAGESLAAGIIFTMPALVMIGFWTDFHWLTTTAIAFTGGLMGILFMIPMRRVFVTRPSDELTFPEGVACAAVLEAGQEEEDTGDAAAIIQGGLVGAITKVLISFVGLFNGVIEGAVALGRSVLYFGSEVSPALIAVGVIVRMNVALLIAIGGAFAWLVCIPILALLDNPSGPAVDIAWGLWGGKVRYIGVGAMVVGGLATIFKVRHSLTEAVRVVRGGRVEGDTEEDLPGTVVAALALLAVVLVGTIYWFFTGGVAVTAVSTIVMVVMSLFFTAVASYIVGLVGNSNSPVSGMTITAVLFTGAMLWLFQMEGTQAMVATLGVAAVVCCVACTSGDVCNDLKTGQLVGASPKKQQIMQILGVTAACLVMAPVLQLLHHNTAGGIGGKELPAPQAKLFSALAQGFFGSGKLPWDMVGIGAVVGVLTLMLDRVLEARRSGFRAHLMPIAVGIYLPFQLAPPILIGGLIAWLVTRNARTEADEERAARPGMLFASGAIAGEALVGVGLAILTSVGVAKLKLGLAESLMIGLSCLALVTLTWLFFRASRGRN